VPGTRLHGLWSTVARYDEWMANWQRLCGDGIDDTEESAVGDVFDALIPEDVAAYYDSFVQNGATVRNRATLEQLMKRPLSDVLDQVEWFEDDEALELSAAGTLLIAEYVYAANPLPVLERVMAEEAKIREHCRLRMHLPIVRASVDRRGQIRCPGLSGVSGGILHSFLRPRC
jgi:hypothetical protein